MRRAAVSLRVALTATAGSADEPADPLWTLAQPRAAASRAWVAQTVRSQTQAEDGAKPRSAMATATLGGWDGSTPRRQVTAEGDAELVQVAQRALPAALNPGDRRAFLCPLTTSPP